MLRLVLAIGPVLLLVAVIGVWAEAAALPLAHRVAAEICRDPEISAVQLGRRVAPRPPERPWLRLSDERPSAWLHRRFLGNRAYKNWIVAKSRSEAGRLARVWVDIGTVDGGKTLVTLASASFDGDCRLLEARSF